MGVSKDLTITPLPPELHGVFEEMEKKEPKPEKEEREAKWYVDLIEEVARQAWYMIRQPQHELKHRKELVKALNAWGERMDENFTLRKEIK